MISQFLKHSKKTNLFGSLSVSFVWVSLKDHLDNSRFGGNGIVDDDPVRKKERSGQRGIAFTRELNFQNLGINIEKVL